MRLINYEEVWQISERLGQISRHYGFFREKKEMRNIIVLWEKESTTFLEKEKSHDRPY